MDHRDIGALRREYTQAGLERHTLDNDPFQQFSVWFQQAVEAQVLEPNAMQLATVDAADRPAVRTVLLKSYDNSGLVFFTNYQSRKAQHIQASPQVAALLFWKELERQVEISGHAEKISSLESLRYFTTRPRGSQLGAWVSAQSAVITSRTLLEIKLEEMKRKFQSGNIPLPDFWGGYRIVPERFEFWQGRPNRLHDRFEYRRQSQGWDIARLSP